MHRLLLALSFIATAASAQTAPGSANGSGPAGTIDPGMSRAQVVERLGKPATVRTYQGSTYLMYSNKCGKACGMQDIVILDHDVVVDAVFRSPDRHYTGTSSSPDATKPNARSVHNQPLAVPTEPPTAAERVKPGTRHVPADSAATSTSHAPVDSANTSTSVAPRDSAPVRPSAGPAPYGKPSTTPPPSDSANTTTSHAPPDNASSSTSHPPKPPK